MTWHRVASVDEIPAEGVVAGQAGETPVALYKLDGLVYATHNICTHAHACLSDGYLEDGRIECPLHQALFDVRTGEVICGPASRPLAVYQVRLDEGQVLIDV